MELKNKRVMLFLKQPRGFRFSGDITEESDNFIILRNDRTGKTNFIAKDNIANLEVME